MKKLLSALAIVTSLLAASCATAPAFAVAMPQCATGQGDTDADAEKFLHNLWPHDTLYLFTGVNMDMMLAAAMFVQNVTTPPPQDTTEVWISSGPGGDGATVFILFAQDCYLGSYTLSQEQFDEALGLAFLGNPPAPLRLPGNPTNHKLIIPLEGARSAFSLDKIGLEKRSTA